MQLVWRACYGSCLRSSLRLKDPNSFQAVFTLDAAVVRFAEIVFMIQILSAVSFCVGALINWYETSLRVLCAWYVAVAILFDVVLFNLFKSDHFKYNTMLCGGSLSEFVIETLVPVCAMTHATIGLNPKRENRCFIWVFHCSDELSSVTSFWYYLCLRSRIVRGDRCFVPRINGAVLDAKPNSVLSVFVDDLSKTYLVLLRFET